MRLLTSVFALILLMSCSVFGQNLGIAPSMGAPRITEAKDIIIKLNKETGKIELFDAKDNQSITQQYQLDLLELEIFDSNGEYAGSLEVKDFSIPRNEVDKTEKVKVANMRFIHTASGEQMTLSNVDFAR
ncbi:MAG: hypothetical protein JKY03_10635 [Aureispira sp.]|nr:hypothetical protein [Aureispira sp.]